MFLYFYFWWTDPFKHFFKWLNFSSHPIILETWLLLSLSPISFHSLISIFHFICDLHYFVFILSNTNHLQNQFQLNLLSLSSQKFQVLNFNKVLCIKVPFFHRELILKLFYKFLKDFCQQKVEKWKKSKTATIDFKLNWFENNLKTIWK